MSLDYTIPKRVPKWVVGFADHLEKHAKVGDAAVPQMALTWKQYEASFWPDFQARGKVRGAKKPKEDKDKPDGKQKRLRQKLKELRRIADDMGSDNMSQIVADLEALVNS